MPTERHRTILPPADLIRLVAATDDALAAVRDWSADRPHKQAWVDSYLRRRRALTTLLDEYPAKLERLRWKRKAEPDPVVA